MWPFSCNDSSTLASRTVPRLHLDSMYTTMEGQSLYICGYLVGVTREQEYLVDLIEELEPTPQLTIAIHSENGIQRELQCGEVTM